jgi:hypothetical protein
MVGEEIGAQQARFEARSRELAQMIDEQHAAAGHGGQVGRDLGDAAIEDVVGGDEFVIGHRYLGRFRDASPDLGLEVCEVDGLGAAGSRLARSKTSTRSPPPSGGSPTKTLVRLRSPWDAGEHDPAGRRKQEVREPAVGIGQLAAASSAAPASGKVGAASQSTSGSGAQRWLEWRGPPGFEVLEMACEMVGAGRQGVVLDEADEDTLRRARG